MGTASLLRAANPRRIIRAIEERGASGFVYHSLRRLGTLAESALVGPELLQLTPMAYVCNHTCSMCFLQYLEPRHLQEMKRVDKQQGLTLQEYVTLFDGMPSGLRVVSLLGGGEPLVHPDSVDIMKEVKRRGWEGSLISNGTLMNQKVAKALVDMRWNSTRISVHAGDPQTYRAVHGVDKFEMLTENLKFFDEYRCYAGVQRECQLVLYHVIQRQNIPTIERLFQVSEQVSADHVVFELMIPYKDEERLTADELRLAKETLILCAEASRLSCTLPNIIVPPNGGERVALKEKPFVPGKRCAVGFDQAFITAFGDVRPCCFSSESMGNIRETSFKEIWKGRRYASFRKRLINGKFANYCISNRCHHRHNRHFTDPAHAKGMALIGHFHQHRIDHR